MSKTESEYNFRTHDKDAVLKQYATNGIQRIGHDQKAIPALAKDGKLLREIECLLPALPTFHEFHRADSTEVEFLTSNSVHLVVTSPPYWTLKKYNDKADSLHVSLKNFITRYWINTKKCALPPKITSSAVK